MASASFVGAFVAMLGIASIQSEEDPIRELVNSSLLEMRASGGFEVHYSTYEVLISSELGSQLRALFMPEAGHSLSARAIVKDLALAAQKTKLSVPDQRNELKKSSAPEHTLETGGLLVGGGPMVFQVVHGRSLYMQTCLSDPNYFSIIRAPEYDIKHFSHEGRLEVADRDDGIMLFTPAEMYFPLPALESGVAMLGSKEWHTRALEDQCVEVQVGLGGSGGPQLRIVMGGPKCKFPLYCMHSTTVGGSQQSAVALFDWELDGESGKLNSVMQVQQSPMQYSVVYYEIAKRNVSVGDTECVLVIRPPRSIVDSRGGQAKVLQLDQLTASVAKLIEVEK
jgi:hypothetical protein